MLKFLFSAINVLSVGIGNIDLKAVITKLRQRVYVPKIIVGQVSSDTRDG